MSPAFRILLICTTPLLLNGCAAGAAGLALTGVSVLSSIVSGEGGNPSELTIDPNRDLSDTLARADHEVEPLCQARLDALNRELGPPEPVPPGQCALRPVCLGGMQKPMQVRVCADGQATPTAIAATSAAGTGTWTWNNVEAESVEAASD